MVSWSCFGSFSLMRDRFKWTCCWYKKMKMFVMFLIVIYGSQHTSTLEVYEGEKFILLPCEYPTFELDDPVVVWSRSDLNPSTVHQLNQKRDELQDQNQLYSGRTSMMANALVTGDLSLNLTILHPSDSGTYICKVTTFRGTRKVGEVALQVKEQFPFWAKAVLFGLCLLAFVVVVVWRLWAYCGNYCESEYQVEVKSGKKSVRLPCKTTVKLPKDVTVEWMDRDLMKVHLYQNGSDQAEEQGCNYIGRTKMKKNPRKTGALSLTLKHPTERDRGIYTCTAHSREGNVLMKKQVELYVKVNRVEVNSGVECIQLPCKTKVKLPEVVTVEWKDNYNLVVHVYQNGFDEPEDNYLGRTEMKKNLRKTGDLSLTLKYPTKIDRGIYTCTAYSGEGNILMKQQVELYVKVQRMDVNSGVESVKLHCKTTLKLPDEVTVEWSDNYNSVVHVYQNGSDQRYQQCRDYRGRTEMKNNLFKSGDLSLTLKYPTNRDSGTYTCTVYSKRGNILMRKQLDLCVSVCQVEVEEGEDFVQLPFKTTSDLPQDYEVDWFRILPDQNIMVPMYHSSTDQLDQHNPYRGRIEMMENPMTPGDLSLTLKKPKGSDTGTYLCRVYGKDESLYDDAGRSYDGDGRFYNGDGRFYDGDARFYDGAGKFYDGDARFYNGDGSLGNWRDKTSCKSSFNSRPGSLYSYKTSFHSRKGSFCSGAGSYILTEQTVKLKIKDQSQNKDDDDEAVNISMDPEPLRFDLVV